MTKICISCGMPMEKPEMYAGGDVKRDYCIYCVDEEGNPKSFERKVLEMTEFTVNRMGISKEKAEAMVRENLLKLPAWKNMQ